GSSSSFTVGMLNSLYALKGKIISKNDLAKQAIHVERDILKENVGSQDQVAVAYGGFNKIIFHNDHNFKIEAMTLPKARINQLQENLILLYTGISRFASDVASEQIKSTKKHKSELLAIRKMVDYAVDILNNGRNMNEFGNLLHESWMLKKGLSSRISNSTIDQIYEVALRSGAIGGKLLGAGGGGFMLLFVPPARQKRLRSALKKVLEVKFSFETDGSKIIYFNP
ncbi:MAG TPA: kinase, partial [Candidatus Omnitrophota bacterium]|nr:kinase [Candidatus Omnitrophota bacterium]